MNTPIRVANTFLKKITPKTVTDAVGLDLTTLQRPVQPRHLYDLFGVIRDITLMPDKSGQGRKDSLRFRGRYQAVTQEGLEFDSPVTYIPGGMDEVLFDVWKAAQASNPEAVIHIALSIGIKTAPAGKPSATGYEFDVQRITAQETPQEDDPIQRLRAQAAHVRQARLEAPQEAEVAPEVESARKDYTLEAAEVPSPAGGEAATESTPEPSFSGSDSPEEKSPHRRGRHR